MKRILVIDDEFEVRSMLSSILQIEGFAMISAEDGRRGVEIAREERPDLILCDCIMPRIDGYGVLKALQGDPSTASIPFIFLTGRGEKSDQRAGMNLGADDFLVKPVATKELIAAIRARLERHRSIQEAPLGFNPDFSSIEALRPLALTPRESEVLLWVAQGKTNPEIATILALRPRTVKKHLEHVFQKLGVESRHAAGLKAIETLSRPITPRDSRPHSPEKS